MIRVDNKTGEPTYDPFYEPGIKNNFLDRTSRLAGLGWLKNRGEFTLDRARIGLEKPDPEVVKELRDNYSKVKAAEKNKLA